MREVTPELILARSELQFGQCRGQTFQWLLKNAVGYAVGLIDSVQKEQQSIIDTPLGVNKRKFCHYALSFDDVTMTSSVRRHQAAEARVAATDDEGKRLLGFGQYRQLTSRRLVESDDREHVSFVRNFLLKKTDCVPGSRLSSSRLTAGDVWNRQHLHRPCQHDTVTAKQRTSRTRNC